ncbi:MAG TPA: NAD(P)H-dependent glycerol-3-phosphate dehydrogenase [Candidatus Acidoferrum sp.]|nr:NAD(P)H-dependent glycerol-3-phosphate dehydrogenase [Candidatus Acidoferrum sp.]
MTRIAILGAGSWGTALSVVLSRARQPHEISLWARNAELADAVQHQRENTAYLAGVRLPDSVSATSSIAKALAGAHIVVGALPSVHARAVYAQALPFVTPETVFVSATKGLEPATHERMSLVLAQMLGKAGTPAAPPRIAVLSGPSFAAEAARGEPTAVVLAAQDAGLANRLQEEFSGPSFRLYTNDDVLGVELAGAMKNVIAIAAGAGQGLGLGSNPLAALITRGLAEMMRLAAALGARPETLGGLAGLGDLVLTCTGALSRNRYVGVELGKGRKLAAILAEMRMVAEGVDTAAPLLALAREHGIDMPITEQVDAILHRGQSPRDAIREIMDRPLKRE